MSIWTVSADVNNYWTVEVINDQMYWEMLTYDVNGQSLRNRWPNLSVRTLQEDRIGGNFPGMSGSLLVVDQKAYQVVQSIVSEFTETLPLTCIDDGYDELVAINVTTVLDCLDHEQSDLTRFNDGRVMWVDKHVFDMECVKGVPIFKIVEHRLNRIYVNDDFKHAVEQNGLKGLIFQPT